MPKLARYLIFTFSVAWLIMIIGVRDYKHAGSAGELTFSNSLMWSMFVPAVGALIAGADFREMGWKPNINKNLKLILFAWLAPTVFELLGAGFYFMVFPDDIQLPGVFIEHTDPVAFAELNGHTGAFWWYFTKEVFYSVTTFYLIPGMILGLGEEIGWRGYLFPELKKRFGRVKAMLLGGTIHGAWHFPIMLLVGYEYGRDYYGAPVLGLFAFCIFTISTGIISYWLYEKSGCILLSGLIHGATNGVFNPFMLRGGEHELRTIFGPAGVGLISVIPMALFAAGVLYFEVKRDNEELWGDFPELQEDTDE